MSRLLATILPIEAWDVIMGKTVKKVHHQGRIHKHASIDVTPETPGQVHARIYKGIRVVCPSCGAKVVLASLAGDDRAFRCSACGCEPSEAADDARARELVAQNDAAKAIVDAAKDLEGQLGQAGFVRRLYLKARLALGRRRVEEARERYAQARALYFRLAQRRYYVSQWFRATGAHLEFAPDARGEERYALKARYEGDAFSVAPADTRALSRGVVGEWALFEALCVRARDVFSPLVGAQLAANLFLPVASLWRQVDAVLFTEVGAFVFEAKSKRAAVRVTKNFGDIDLRDRKGKHRSELWALKQCDMHADSLEEVADGLTLDDIYEVTVFVEPLSFESAEVGFSADNVFVGALDCEGVEDFVAAIDRIPEVVAELRERGVSVMSAERCEELARDLTLRYGDLGRGRMHRRIARLREISSGGAGREGHQVFTSGSMCR